MRAARGSLRRGTAILEVLVASMILGTAGIAAMALLSQSWQSMRAAERAEREVIETSELLDRLDFLGADSLAALSGWSRRGRWALHVVPIGDSLFDVAVSARPGSAPLLTTTFYRPAGDAR
jgi:Tfp pilus assembly protein PilV